MKLHVKVVALGQMRLLPGIKVKFKKFPLNITGVQFDFPLKGKRQLKRAREETFVNKTKSILNFVPTTEDDKKSITCRAENPKVSGLFLETTWKIDVVCKS